MCRCEGMCECVGVYRGVRARVQQHCDDVVVAQTAWWDRGVIFVKYVALRYFVM